MTSHDPGGGTPTSITRLPDGRLDLRISKTLLGDLRTCPARAQWKLTHPGEDLPSCLSTLGTAAHLGMELTAREWKRLGRVDVDVMEDTWAEAMLWWYRQWDASNWMHQEHHRITSSSHGAHLLATIANRWYDRVVPDLHSDVTAWKLEQRYERLFIDNDRWRITLVGTVDLTTTDRCYDWKTGKVDQPWFAERYDVQSTIYSYLTGQPCSIVYVPRERLDVVKVYKLDRHAGHLAVLTMELERIAHMIDRVGLDEPWQMRPDHSLCSERWCPAFARGECVGEHLSIYPDEAVR